MRRANPHAADKPGGFCAAQKANSETLPAVMRGEACLESALHGVSSLPTSANNTATSKARATCLHKAPNKRVGERVKACFASSVTCCKTTKQGTTTC